MILMHLMLQIEAPFHDYVVVVMELEKCQNLKHKDDFPTDPADFIHERSSKVLSTFQHSFVLPFLSLQCLLLILL